MKKRRREEGSTYGSVPISSPMSSRRNGGSGSRYSISGSSSSSSYKYTYINRKESEGDEETTGTSSSSSEDDDEEEDEKTVTALASSTTKKKTKSRSVYNSTPGVFSFFEALPDELMGRVCEYVTLEQIVNGVFLLSKVILIEYMNYLIESNGKKKKEERREEEARC